PSGFRSDIQGLRALAVGIVLLYHLWPDRFVGGFVGVDVFFVISGFLITSHLIKSPPRSWGDVAKFWARRVRRLLPASLLVLFSLGSQPSWLLHNRSGPIPDARSSLLASTSSTGTSPYPASTIWLRTMLRRRSNISGRCPDRKSVVSSGR